MADGQEIIRYVIEIDTAAGKAAIREMLEGGSQAGGAQVGGGAGGAEREAPSGPSQQVQVDQLNVLSDILKTMQGMANDISDATDEDEGEEENKTFDLFKSVSGRIKAAGLGLAFAQTPGQMVGVVGAVLPGKIGATVSAFGVLTDKTIQLALSIADFNGELFAAKTQWELFWMGFKIELAEGTSQALASLMLNAEALAEDALPILIGVVNILAGALNIMVSAIRLVVNALVFLVQAIQWVVDTLIKIIVEIASLGFADTEDWSPTGDLVSGIGDLISALVDNTTELKLAKEGQALMLALPTAMRAFAGATEGEHFQGRQGGVGKSLMPTVPSKMVRDKMATMQHSEGVGGQATAQAFPRPTPAAVNFKVTDQINVQAGDEAAMLSEMLSVKNQVLSLVQGIHDQRWARLREARAITLGNHFGVLGT